MGVDNELKVIAKIENDYTEKFGIPRQSGLVSISSRIVFEPEYRAAEALRGLERFSHIWLLWLFSETRSEKWSPTVRPPMLGGNVRMGVFATRSPFRPNPIGMSCVRLDRIAAEGSDGTVLYVTGADLMNGTPIIDIKPYLAYADSYPEAEGGYGGESGAPLKVVIPEDMAAALPADRLGVLRQVLSYDPRPRYQSSPERVYTMSFGELEVSFNVDNNRLTVINIINRRN